MGLGNTVALAPAAEPLLPSAWWLREELKPGKAERLFLKKATREIKSAQREKKTQVDVEAPVKFRKNTASTRGFWTVITEVAKDAGYRAHLVFEHEDRWARAVEDLERKENGNERVKAIRLDWSGPQPRREGW